LQPGHAIGSFPKMGGLLTCLAIRLRLQDADEGRFADALVVLTNLLGYSRFANRVALSVFTAKYHVTAQLVEEPILPQGTDQ
jgi:hypothetical protein